MTKQKNTSNVFFIFLYYKVNCSLYNIMVCVFAKFNDADT